MLVRHVASIRQQSGKQSWFTIDRLVRRTDSMTESGSTEDRKTRTKGWFTIDRLVRRVVSIRQQDENKGLVYH